MMMAAVDQRHKRTPSRMSIAKSILTLIRGYAKTAANSAGSASGHDCHAIRNRTSSRVTSLAARPSERALLSTVTVRDGVWRFSGHAA